MQPCSGTKSAQNSGDQQHRPLCGAGLLPQATVMPSCLLGMGAAAQKLSREGGLLPALEAQGTPWRGTGGGGATSLTSPAGQGGMDTRLALQTGRQDSLLLSCHLVHRPVLFSSES